MRKLVWTVFAVGVSAVCSPAWGATFAPLGGLDGNVSFTPRAISGDGSTVVGTGPSTPGQQAIRWDETNGTQGLGDLPGGAFLSSANAVSADGSIAVGYSISASGVEAFTWDTGNGMQGIGDLTGGAHISHAVGISADGATVVGNGNSASGTEAFVWTSSGGMMGLGDLPGGDYESGAIRASADGAVVAGYASSAVGLEAFVWDATNGMVGLGGLPGGSGESTGGYVSADGTVVVGSAVGAGGLEVFRWDAGSGMQGLGIPPGCLDARVTGVSADGSVIVGFCNLLPFGDDSMAIIWDSTHGYRSLHTVLSNAGVDLSGWTLDTAVDISDDGTRVVGVATETGFPADTVGFVADLPVPAVPAMGPTGILVLIACLTAGGLARLQSPDR